jgi:drug/metabolite transporter (DMT)-like permease
VHTNNSDGSDGGTGDHQLLLSIGQSFQVSVKSLKNLFIDLIKLDWYHLLFTLLPHASTGMTTMTIKTQPRMQQQQQQQQQQQREEEERSRPDVYTRRGHFKVVTTVLSLQVMTMILIHKIATIQQSEGFFVPRHDRRRSSHVSDRLFQRDARQTPPTQRIGYRQNSPVLLRASTASTTSTSKIKPSSVVSRSNKQGVLQYDSLVRSRSSGRTASTIPATSTLASSSSSYSINVFQNPTTDVSPSSAITSGMIDQQNISKSSSSSTATAAAAAAIPDDNDRNKEGYQKGLATIGFITLLFSSNSPALHAAFSSSSSPPVLLLNCAVSLVALVGLTLGGTTLDSKTVPTANIPISVSPLEKQTKPAAAGTANDDDDGDHDGVSGDDALAWVAGSELGLWKTLGTVANIWGLALTSASHGALLIQLTTLIVPVVQGIQGVPIPPKIQLAIILALLGVVCFTQDTGTIESSTTAAMAAVVHPDVFATSAASVTTADMTSSLEIFHTTISATIAGDTLCVVAAIFYSVYDLRLFVRGRQVPTKALITRKIATQALLSLALLISISGSDSMAYIQSTIDGIGYAGDDGFGGAAVEAGAAPSISQLTSYLLIPAVVLWSGIAVNAVAPYLQVGGQQVVGPTRCQTIYASQPLWAAMLSYIFLGETVGERGLIGGSIFIAALFLAATSEVPHPDCNSTKCDGDVY